MKLGIYNYVVGVTTHANPLALRQRGWSGRTRDLSRVGWFLVPFCFILPFATNPAPVNDFDDLYIIRRASAHGSAFWGSRSYYSTS